jgi:chromosome segregation protein
LNLKSLTLRGFKSFADKTTLMFEPGISVVIGPNGSGKSNLVDAILWVFGEQSPSSLRASSMEDVIFSGSSKRPALGLAEVCLVLDNSDGFLPLEFSEISITRRLYRSGESQYFLNGSLCRLLDIQELLSDANLGQKLHTVVSQGDLDRIITARSEERRMLIEEVAGVLKHRRRQERVSRKLETLSFNIEKIKERIAQIDQQLKPLKRQASRAKKFEKLQAELRELSLNLLAFELSRSKEMWERLELEGEKLETELKKTQEDLARVEEALARCQTELSKKGLSATDMGEFKERFHSIYEKISGNLKVLEEKGHNLIEKASTLRQEIYQTEKKLKEKEERLDDYQQEKATQDALLADAHLELKELQRRSEQAKKSKKKWDEKVKKIKSELELVQKEIGELQNEKSEQAELVAKVESSLKLSRREKEKLSGQKKAVFREIRKVKEGLKEVKELKQAAEQACLSLAKEIVLTQEEMRVLVREKEKAEERMRELQAAQQLVQKVLNLPSKSGALKSHRLISEVIKVKSGYEKAVDGYLRDLLHAYLVDKKSKAIKVLSKLAQLPSAKLMVTEAIKKTGGKGPDLPTLRTGVVLTNDEARSLEWLFKQVYVADSPQQALELSLEFPSLTFVTLDGWLAQNGLITSPLKKSFLEMGKELAELNQQLGEVVVEIKRSSSEEERLRGWLSQLQEKEKIQRESLSELEAKELIQKRHLKHLIEEEKEILNQLELVEKEVSSVEESLKETIRLFSETKEKLDELKNKAAKLNTLLSEVVEQQIKEQSLEERLSQEVNQAQTRISSLIEKGALIKREIILLERETRESRELLETLKKSVKSLEMLVKRIDPLNQVYLKLLQLAQSRINWLDEFRVTQRGAFTSLGEQMKKLQTESRQLQKALLEKQQALSGVKEEKGKVKERVTLLGRQAAQEFKVSIEKLLREYPNFSFTKEEIEARLEEAKRRLERLGTVNALALRDWESLQAKRDALDEQLQDILAVKKVILKIMKAVEKKLRGRFLVAFESVNQNFKDIFKTLFPGGEASLLLVGENPLEGGVEIVAEPHGKKLRRLSLLSGGERSLVALSLLLAFHRTSPSPLYVFDEVEPALDSANLTRFIKLLLKMKEEAQVIIITHQRLTMEVGDVLYGVSMGADGISKVYSQRVPQRMTQVEMA